MPETQETWVRSLGQEDPLEESMATHSSILAWRNPGKEEPCELQSKESNMTEATWAPFFSWGSEVSSLDTFSSSLLRILSEFLELWARNLGQSPNTHFLNDQMTKKNIFFLSNHIITFVSAPDQLWHTTIFGFSELHFLLAVTGVSIYVLSTMLSTSLTTFHFILKNENLTWVSLSSSFTDEGTD